MAAEKTLPPLPPKQVVDDVSGYLRLYDDGSVDRTWTGSPAALPLMTPVPPSATPLDHGVSLHDLPGHPLLRLYLPSPPPLPSSLPVLLHFHGGGFCFSHFSWYMYHQFYSRLAAAIPALVVSVELPLAPEHRLPAAIDAAFAALLRLRFIARSPASADDDPVEDLLRSSADFSRVFLVGDSSGGNLVHHVAVRAGDEPEGFWSPLRLAGGLPIHPGFVRSRRSRSEMELPDSPFFTREMLDKFLNLGLPEGADRDHPYTSPMGEAAPPLEEVRLPPFLVAVAEGDLLRDTELEYCEAMKRAGKEVEVLVSYDVSHCFYLNTLAMDEDPTAAKRTEELVAAIKDFVGRH